MNDLDAALADREPDEFIPLWPDGAPGGASATAVEEIIERPNDLALRDRIVRGELHVFEEGGHGFGLRFARDKPAAVWPALFHAWGRRHGVFG